MKYKYLANISDQKKLCFRQILYYNVPDKLKKIQYLVWTQISMSIQNKDDF